MEKRLPASHPLKQRKVIFLTLFVMLVLGVMMAILFSPQTPAAKCDGCQACYCDYIMFENGRTVCYVNGQPSACIGCVGACSGEPPNAECKATPGLGGCGSYIAWERDSDCNSTPEATDTLVPTPTATPRPPRSCPETTWVKVQKPSADIKHEPPYPLVARQDTTNTGFTLHFNVTGGWAKKYEQKPVQMCRQRGKTYPDDCPDHWQWVCVRKILEQYNDPIVQVDLGMRLGDGVKEWIEQDLGSRYYGATVQDDLPRVWQLYKGGGVMSWTYDFEYHPLDPGTHGGRLMVTTQGTRLNRPQQVSFPYEVPVYLWDTTLGD